MKTLGVTAAALNDAAVDMFGAILDAGGSVGLARVGGRLLIGLVAPAAILDIVRKEPAAYGVALLDDHEDETAAAEIRKGMVNL